MWGWLILCTIVLSSCGTVSSPVVPTESRAKCILLIVTEDNLPKAKRLAPQVEMKDVLMTYECYKDLSLEGLNLLLESGGHP